MDNGYGNQNSYPDQQSNDQWNQNGRLQSKDYGYNSQQVRNNDHRRQAEFDRI
jgi:hypothetical protein